MSAGYIRAAAQHKEILPSSMNNPKADEHPGPVPHRMHEHRTTQPWLKHTIHTAVRPKNHIILRRIIPTLKEIKENMLRLDVDISRVRPTHSQHVTPYRIQMAWGAKDSRNSLITKPLRLLNPRTMPWKCRMPQRRELLRAQRAERIDRR